MPTNILRKRADEHPPGGAKPRQASGTAPDSTRTTATGPRRAILSAGRTRIRIEFASTPTADLVWNALPLHSTAVTWGRAIHFKTPLEAGRDRTARILAHIGEIYFWVENDRIVVPFGPTPISRPGEIRLQAPGNVFARSLDDLTVLATLTPGEKVSLTAV